MEIDKIKEIVHYLNNVSYRDLFGALMVFERVDYLHDLEDLDKSDIEYLEDVYDYFMDNDYFTGLMNCSEIIEMYEEDKKINID